MNAQPKFVMTEAEYLAYEGASLERHEFFNGEIVLMAGGSPDHALIAANIMGAFQRALKGRPCRVFSSDLRLQLNETGAYVYPDVSVVCGLVETGRSESLTNPTLVVEILSPSTAMHDRGLKLIHYRQVRSLTDVLLVDSTQVGVDAYRRDAEGHWEMRERSRLSGVVETGIGAALPLDEIYAGVSWQG
jgi:Uma2 family endonuclease